MDKADAFAELFRAEHPGLVRELRLILGDAGLAEEIAAEAFVEMWRRWEHVGGLERPGAWVRKVSIRKAARARWRRGRRAAVESSFDVQRLDAADAVDIDLHRALAHLPLAQRTAVVMHHLGGWPTADIAAALGCADVTVRAHLTRGRQRLAELLEDRHDVEANDAR